MNFAKQGRRFEAGAVPAEPPSEAPQDAAQHASAGMVPGARGAAAPRRRSFAWLGTAASLLLFAVALYVLWRLVSDVKWADLRTAFTAASAAQIGLAVGLTAASYLLLTGYDALALRQLRLKVPYRTTAFASFASYAVSFNLGFPLVTAGTVRYWIYSPKGLSTAKVAGLTVIAGFTFWLGMGLVLGVSLVREAGPLALLTYTTLKLNQLVGVVTLAVVGSYLAWVSVRTRSVRVQGWRLEMPGFGLSLGQMLIGAADVMASAGVLFLLLPEGHGIDYATFLAVYVFAVMLGIASHAPGGLGVFEATVLLALSASLPREPVLGALLLFRVIYYLAPFVIALAALGLYEIARRLGTGRREWRGEEAGEEEIGG